MAGSYHHLLPDEDGGGGWSLIENMGDAYECVEELFWLVERCIGREAALRELEVFYAMKRRDIAADYTFQFVQTQMEGNDDGNDTRG